MKIYATMLDEFVFYGQCTEEPCTVAQSAILAGFVGEKKFSQHPMSKNSKFKIIL